LTLTVLDKKNKLNSIILIREKSLIVLSLNWKSWLFHYLLDLVYRFRLVIQELPKQGVFDFLRQKQRTALLHEVSAHDLMRHINLY